ncbi:MAG: cytochrome c [Planctomycetota bacterium]|nr:cytochrome c [Planctomycetota bacterium]
MRTACLVLAGSLLLALGFSCSDAADYSGTGPELFQNQCASCHMGDGAGSQLAPPLHGKKSHWTRESLVAYLRDPVGYAAKDPRLRTQGQKFSLAMPTYKMLPQSALELLADHVLAMP